MNAEKMIELLQKVPPKSEVRICGDFEGVIQGLEYSKKADKVYIFCDDVD